jgi:hypothetical protein
MLLQDGIEMSEKKVVRRSVVVALGAICIVLAASLIGAFAILSTKSSQNSQSDLQSWTEGSFYFNLTSDMDINFTIPTAGFSSVTITIDALCPLSSPYGVGFQVFIGFITSNTTIDYTVYDAQSYPQTVMPFAQVAPWYYYNFKPASFKQTYEVSFSNIIVWIWNNSTVFSTSPPIWGNVYYYLTT